MQRPIKNPYHENICEIFCFFDCGCCCIPNACSFGGGGGTSTKPGGTSAPGGYPNQGGNKPKVQTAGTAFGQIKSCKTVNGTVANANPRDKNHFDCLKSAYTGKEYKTGKACKLVFKKPDTEVVYELDGKTYSFDPTKNNGSILPKNSYFFNHTPPEQGYDTRLLSATISLTFPTQQQFVNDTYQVGFSYFGKALPAVDDKGRQYITFEKNTAYAPFRGQETVDSICVIAK